MGESVVLTIPPALLDSLHLSAGVSVVLAVDNGRLVIEPCMRPRYALSDLLAQCDPLAKVSAEEQEWMDAPAVGREVI